MRLWGVCVCVLSMCQLMVYTSFSNASVPSAWLSNVAALKYMKICSLLACKSSFLGLKQEDTHTLKQQRHTHTHSQSHIGTAWNAFYADWVQALSWSESTLKFDTQLRAAVSPPLARSASQSRTAATTASRSDIYISTETFWLLVNLDAFSRRTIFLAKNTFFQTWRHALEPRHFFRVLNYSCTSSWATHISNEESLALPYF